MNSTDLVYEDWRYIPRFEGIYIISNRGVIIKVARLRFMSRRFKNPTKLHYTKTVVLKTHKSRNGYMLTSVFKKGFRIATTVHRLLAIVFIPNPNNLPQVNHKDGVKDNNVFYNLEWMNQKDNMLHAFMDGKNPNHREKARERMRLLGIKYGAVNTHYLLEKNIEISKPVIQLSMDGKFINEYPSLKAAKRATNSHNIQKVARGLYAQSGGFKWQYK